MSAAPRDVKHKPIDLQARRANKPGYNPQAERAFLGAYYLSPLDPFAETWAGKVYSADLDEVKHRAVFEAIQSIRLGGNLPDDALVNAWLSEHRKLREWPDWEVEISLACASATKIAEYARIVVENSLLRSERAVSTRLYQGSIMRVEAMFALEAIEDRLHALDLPSIEVERLLPGKMASDITPEPIDWIWPGFLARGKLTGFSGEPGLGKGMVGTQIVARFTRGQPLPGMRGHYEPFNVVMLTPEDDAADTIVPRLIAAGADLSKVRILSDWVDDTGVKHQFTIPRDIARIEEVITHDGAGLFLVDPIMGVLDAGVKTGIDSEVRAALMPLKDMAERTRCAVPYVLHLNKDGRNTNALQRSGGSIAFQALARFTFLIAKHPDDDTIRVMADVKHNIGTGAPSLIFDIHQTPGKDETYAALRWSQEPCTLRADELLTRDNSNVGKQRKDVLAVFQQVQIASILQIASYLDIDIDDKKARNNLEKLLKRMLDAGDLIKPDRGTYALSTHTSETSDHSVSS